MLDQKWYHRHRPKAPKQHERKRDRKFKQNAKSYWCFDDVCALFSFCSWELSGRWWWYNFWLRSLMLAAIVKSGYRLDVNQLAAATTPGLARAALMLLKTTVR
eukprot:5349663-Amphidinium_carterae.1